MKRYSAVVPANCLTRVLACAVFCCLAVPALAQFPSLSPLPGTGSLKSSTGTKFTFVVAGDNRPCEKTAKQSDTPKDIFEAAAKLQPAFVLWTGDSIYGKQSCDKSGSDPCDSSKVEKEYKDFFEIAKKAGVPVFNAPGNHEMDNKDDVPNQDMTAIYAKFAAQPYGSFDYGNSHFIALDSEEVGGVTSDAATGKSSKTKGSDPGFVSQAQINALDQDLQANQGKTHIFIFMHHPMKPYKSADGLDPASTTALKAVFAKYNNISYVLSGHEHMYYNPEGKKSTDPPPSRTDPSKDKPYYIVTGGAGAPLKGSSKACDSSDSKVPGAFFHYLVFEVDGSKVKAEIDQLK